MACSTRTIARGHFVRQAHWPLGAAQVKHSAMYWQMVWIPASTVTSRKRVRPTVVRLWPSWSRPRNFEDPYRTMQVWAMRPAAWERVSTRRSLRRVWMC